MAEMRFLVWGGTQCTKSHLFNYSVSCRACSGRDTVNDTVLYSFLAPTGPCQKTTKRKRELAATRPTHAIASPEPSYQRIVQAIHDDTGDCPWYLVEHFCWIERNDLHTSRTGTLKIANCVLPATPAFSCKCFPSPTCNQIPRNSIQSEVIAGNRERDEIESVSTTRLPTRYLSPISDSIDQ